MLTQQSLDNVIVRAYLEKIDGEDEGRDDCINALVLFHEETLVKAREAMRKSEQMIEEVKAMQ